MTTTQSASEVERFREIVVRCLGLNFEEGRLAQLEEVLGRRLEARREDIESYLVRFEIPARREDELQALAQELTVNETYFFRNIDQFRAVMEAVLPERMKAKAGRRTLHLLSAGCASGEEPYTLAMLKHESNSLLDGWDVVIKALDVDAVVLERARGARYTAWALRETPPAARERWFHREGNEYVLKGDIRESVTFSEGNLATDLPEILKPGLYDVIFCRNVLMYFSQAQAQSAIARITNALAPGGYLFLGHAETLRGLSNDYHLCHTHGTFYYQIKEPNERNHTPGLLNTVQLKPTANPTANRDFQVSTEDSRIIAIRHASDHVRDLAAKHAENGNLAIAEAPNSPSNSSREIWDVGLAMELLRSERFAEALDNVHSLPLESALDPDVLLLRAVLLTLNGDLSNAEKACRELLSLDEMSAGAHYLMALCREGAGDNAGAAICNQAAVYLDPGFAMPHLHLGFLARRAGDIKTASRELGQAILLLKREEASRLLFFGGGFSREALLSICQAELARCGGAK